MTHTYIMKFFIFLLLGLMVNPTIFAYPTQSATLEMVKYQSEDKYIAFQGGMPYPSFERQRDRTYISLNGIWKMERSNVDHKLTLAKRIQAVIEELEEEGQARHSINYDDGNWQECELPHCVNMPPDRYQDGVWYRKWINVPFAHRDKFIKLVFLGANYVVDIWINGEWIGTHEGGYTSFAFDVSKYLNYGESNLISIRLDNIPWKLNDENIVPYAIGDWWNYGGINRDMYLEVTDNISIVRTNVKPAIVSHTEGEATVDVWIYNKSTKQKEVVTNIEVFDTKITTANIISPFSSDIIDEAKSIRIEGIKEISKEISPNMVSIFNYRVTLSNIELWSPDNPHLYVLKVKCISDGEILDEYYTQFGIKDISVDKKNCALLLNGEPIFLKGVARHEDFPDIGRKVSYDETERIYHDLLIIKDMNANFLRSAHYSNHPVFYVLTDRLGLLVWEEIPMFWFGGSQFDVQRKERRIGWQMWMEMIYRDLNRSSIGFWSTCNECSWQTERARFIRDLHRWSDRIDGTRLVVQSAAGNDPTDPSQIECDIIGFTMYHGVFYGKEYYEDTKKGLDETHAFFPTKPIVATEFGYWSQPDLSEANRQVEVARETYRAFKEKSCVSGVCWWAAFDWHTMIGDPQTMGAVTMDRNSFKPVYFVLQSLYKESNFYIRIFTPEADQTVSGTIPLIVTMIRGPGSPKIERLYYSVDSQCSIPINLPEEMPAGTAVSDNIDTSILQDGEHTIMVSAINTRGEVTSEQISVQIDSRDDPPQLEIISPNNQDLVMKKARIKVIARDDRCQPTVSCSFDGAESELVPCSGEGSYLMGYDVSNFTDGSTVEALVECQDTGGHVVSEKITVVVDNKPGNYVQLPYNSDWISWDSNYTDGTGWDFPAEELPDSNTDFIFNGKEKVKFLFGDKTDGQANSVECSGQKIALPPGIYKKIHILGTMHNGSEIFPFVIHYSDGSTEEKDIGFSDWWGVKPAWNEEIALLCSHHHEKTGDRKPHVAIYVRTIELDGARTLTDLELPSDDRLHIFAITLE
jgi:hypothetical protein